MFRYKRSLPLRYDQQGYIYFASKMYRFLSQERQQKILNLCAEAGGEYHRALFEFVTTGTGAAAICSKHYLSQSTLERAVKRYYLLFAKEML